MAYVQLNGPGPWIPQPPPLITALTITSSVIDATGEKFAWSGRVWTPNRGTKSVRNVGFLFGTVTKSGGSGLTVSLQDVATGATPVQPDETQDQTVAIANGDAGFVSNAWYTTGNLSADRSVTFGELLSVVVEYDGGGRTNPDAVNFRNLTRTSLGGTGGHFPAATLKTASWAATATIPNIVLVFSDGTYGTLLGAFPCSAVSQLLFKQDTATTDEYSIRIVPNFNCKVDGLWAIMGVAAATADFSFVLYDGTTAMTGGTVVHDGNLFVASSEDRLVEVPFSQEIELTAGTTYRLAVKPTQTTSNVRLAYFDVGVAGHLNAHGMGSSSIIDGRLNEGSWNADVATRRPFLGLRVSSVDDGTGSGGGGGGLKLVGTGGLAG